MFKIKPSSPHFIPIHISASVIPNNDGWGKIQKLGETRDMTGPCSMKGRPWLEAKVDTFVPAFGSSFSATWSHRQLSTNTNMVLKTESQHVLSFFSLTALLQCLWPDLECLWKMLGPQSLGIGSGKYCISEGEIHNRHKKGIDKCTDNSATCTYR